MTNLKQFMQFDRPESMKMTWNRPAYCYFSIWLVYRKMWKWAIFYPAGFSLTALAFVASLPAAKRSWFLPLFFLAVAGALLFLLPRMANWLYYRHCKSLIRKAQRACPAFHEQIFYLARAGGTHSIPFTAIGYVAVLLVVFILMVTGMQCFRFQYTVHEAPLPQTRIIAPFPEHVRCPEKEGPALLQALRTPWMC